MSSLAFKRMNAASEILRNHIKKGYESQEFDEPWRNLPEVPNKDEIMPEKDEAEAETEGSEQWDAYQKDEYDPKLPHNIVNGPWQSKEAYIAAHYQILREDAIAGLRKSVAEIKRQPYMKDSDNTYIYDFVTIKGILLSPIGPAFRVEFSHERAGKQIRWAQSKRLVAGTIVALSPQKDMFRRICKIAVVAARPISGGLDQNPPSIDLFWGDANDAVFDPVVQYVMVEAKTGYFEASRHMLVAMQKLMTERFHLAKHIALLDPDIKAPEFLEHNPYMDLSYLLHPESEAEHHGTQGGINLENFDVVNNFVNVPNTGMDESQMAALKSMLTKKIAIIQGPPGTGKTFVSVSALRAMIHNCHPGDPPIIVTAQTNHALDQILNHIMDFEPNILRLGGRSDPANLAIRKRTLYELRVGNPMQGGNAGLGRNRKQRAESILDIQRIMFPILTNKILSAEVLHKNELITDAQRDSLLEDGWSGEALTGEIDSWLGEQLIPVPFTPSVNMGLPLEDCDVEFEQQQDLELEMSAADVSEDQERDALSGTYLLFGRKFTGRHAPNSSDKKVKKLLASKKGLYDIPIGDRGEVYRYWEKQINKIMLKDLLSHLKKYQNIVDEGRIVKGLTNIRLLDHLNIKVVGCTTTGLSKYRALIAALQPRTMLIEEAAETLEGTVIAGMIDSLEQLILVGDHQQLQAHCNIGALEGPPYNLNISMFERLVNNSIGYVMLNKQRRMITDVRELLCIEPAPFYENLYDHPSVFDRVINRPPVAGMGGRDTYFMHHAWPESRGADGSRSNRDEVEMIVGLFNHLVMNGLETSKITVLTFYNGQRKLILEELKKHPNLRGTSYFHVHTVDSYQGEENDVILLSLVRSNNNMGIGFLDSKNRLVVALSRARRGLYIFGNAITLTFTESADGEVVGREPLFSPLIQYLRRTGRFNLDGGLPITCSKHKKTTEIFEPDGWIRMAGGCRKKCNELLVCGHECPALCHPFEHSYIICQAPCARSVECGHGCGQICSEKCICLQCDFTNDASQDKMEESSNSIFDDGPGNMGFLPSNASNDNASNRLHGSRQKDKRRVTFSPAPAKSKFVASDARNNSGCQLGPSKPHRSFSGQPGLKSILSPLSQLSSPAAWRSWNAEQADRKLIEQRRIESFEGPKVDASTLTYKETWRRVTIKDGTRVHDPSGPVHTTLHRGAEAEAEPLISFPPVPDNQKPIWELDDAEDKIPEHFMVNTGFSQPESSIDELARDLSGSSMNDALPTSSKGSKEESSKLGKGNIIDDEENLIDFD